MCVFKMPILFGTGRNSIVAKTSTVELPFSCICTWLWWQETKSPGKIVSIPNQQLSIGFNSSNGTVVDVAFVREGPEVLLLVVVGAVDKSQVE